MVLAAAVVSEQVTARDLHLFDLFAQVGMYEDADPFLAVPESVVRAAFDTFKLGGPNIHYHKGLFQNTVPGGKGGAIAVLRIDVHFYDSYQDALYSMYESVPVGGIVIFDGVMSHPAVMRCWLDFKQDQRLSETLNRIDWGSAWFRKEREVQVDQRWFRPPFDVNVQENEHP